MRVEAPKFSVLYNGKNITADIAKYMLSITYNDKTAGESDEIDIELEDVDGRWQNSWYPEKGATLTVTMGALNCGVFEIDEIEIKGPPSTVNIRGAAMGIKNSLKSTKSDAHEKKTLKQIAEKVASGNNLTISGDVPEITIDRVTQNKETDLGFLKRISKDYGIVFSVRGSVITFMSVYTLEARGTVTTIDITDLSGYNAKDKTDAPKSTKSVHANAKKNEKIEVNQDFEAWKQKEGYSAPASKSGTNITSYSKSDNKQQAEAKAKAVMHTSATNQFEGNFEMERNDLMCAGNNFNLTGLGILSGKWHIISSSHKIDKSGGGSTSVECKRLKTPLKSDQVTVKKKKQQPKSVKVVKGSLDYNKDVFGLYDPFNNPLK